MNVADIGANVGYFSLVASRSVPAGASVYAFEPLPRNVAHLRRHLKLNEVTNVTVFQVALWSSDSMLPFDSELGPSFSNVNEGGTQVVPARSLDSLLSQGLISPPDVMKIDVEGSEYEVLRGAKRCFDLKRPAVLLATHGEEVRKKCWDFLQFLGYRFESMDDFPVTESHELLAIPTTR